MCRSWCEAIIAIVVLAFTFWDSFAWSKTVVIVAAVALLIHSFMCKSCFSGSGMSAKKRR